MATDVSPQEQPLTPRLQREGCLLFVDDEPGILKSLQRLFRPLGYTILLANNGKQALDLLAENSVDVIVSDMRMPEMSGAELLEQVAMKWPETFRLLLTGYADMDSAVKAINDGHIFTYLHKPWDDDEIIMAIDQAIDQKMLLDDKQQFSQRIREYNDQLRTLNSELETKVEERTRELSEANQLLNSANEQLRQSYFATVQVFAKLLPSRNGRSPERLDKISHEAFNLGQLAGLESNALQELRLAAVLCDIGKLTLSNEILEKPYVALSADELKQYHQHPVKAQAALAELEPLQQVAGIIRSHCERFDGKGFPDRLKGTEIPIAARIICIVKDFDALLYGNLLHEALSAQETLDYLTEHSGQRYDPQLLDQYMAFLDSGQSAHINLHEFKITVSKLEEGMILSRNLHNHDGMLILKQGQTLEKEMITKIQRLVAGTNKSLSAYILPKEEI